MDNAALRKLIAETLACDSLQEDERRLLQALHLRLLTFGEQTVISGDDRIHVLAIVSAQRMVPSLYTADELAERLSSIACQRSA